MQKMILVTETGSNITPELATQYQIHMMPMHTAFDGAAKDDGTFPTEDICSFYQATGKLPTTSGSTPEDFNRAFDAIHACILALRSKTADWWPRKKTRQNGPCGSKAD